MSSVSASAQAPLIGVTGDGAAVSESLFSVNPLTGATGFLAALGNGDDGEVIVFGAADGQIYHFSGIGGGTIFEKVDPGTFAVTPIPYTGFGTNGSEVVAAAYNPATGEFLVGARDSNLYSISPNGDSRVIANIGIYSKGMAFQGTDFYVLEQFDSFDGDGMVDLVRVDPATGAILGTVHLSGVPLNNRTNGLAVDPATGTMYAIVQGAGRQLVTIDPATGVATLVAVLSDSFAALTFIGFHGIELFLSESIYSAAESTFGGGDALASLPLHGAHHKPLLLQRGLETDNCAWVTGDIADYRENDATAGLIEIGMCHDFAPGLRMGLGIGQSYLDSDLAFGGETEMDGQYAIFEINYQLPNLPLVATGNLLYGDWDADVDRNYLSGGSVFRSRGETDVNATAFRLRLDYTGIDAGPNTITPRVEYTETDIDVDGYTERGGLFPLTFDDRDNTERELRVGVDAEVPLGERLQLTLLLEGVHRFDDAGPNITGTFFDQPWSLRGQSRDDTWARVGFGFDYRLAGHLFVSANVNGSTDGQDGRVSGGLGLRYAF